MNSLNIVVGITTFRRPLLLRQALKAVAELNGPRNITVLVADNDRINMEGIKVATECGSGFPFALTTIVVEPQGFTHGRNALLEYGFLELRADFVAIMDDDQIPERDWLVKLLAAHHETGATVVGPAVLPMFESPPSSWTAYSPAHHRDKTTNGLVPQLYGDGGVLISAQFLNLLPRPWYDHSFSVTGGADADLFYRLRKAGGTFARSSHSKIHEYYTQSRLTLSWTLKRAYRVGNSDMRILWKHRLWLRLCQETMKIPVALVLLPLPAIVLLPSTKMRTTLLWKWMRALGKASALLGMSSREYSSIHGE